VVINVPAGDDILLLLLLLLLSLNDDVKMPTGRHSNDNK